MPLTDTAIRALKPKSVRYSRSDERGLVLEVFPTGGMLWHYRYRLNGKQERVTLGRYPALSLKRARAERDRRETLVAQGQSPAVQKQLAKQGAAPDTTVAEFGERFFREVVAKDRQDLTIPRRYFDKSIVPAIGTKAVRDVTTEDVRAIIWRKKDEGFDAAAGNIRSVLKRLFDYAQTAGLVTTNPVLALPMPSCPWSFWPPATVWWSAALIAVGGAVVAAARCDVADASARAQLAGIGCMKEIGASSSLPKLTSSQAERVASSLRSNWLLSSWPDLWPWKAPMRLCPSR